MIDVSIVIVCMNNLKNLYPCLNSIRKYTTVSYETLVVAYLFSEENLKKVEKDFPWVTFLESNEIRGFSENNNVALRQAKGKYCFVVNDDTIMEEDVIGKLIRSFDVIVDPVAAVISPVLLNSDHSVQVCGRPPFRAKEYVMSILHLWSERKDGGRYIDKEGIFKSYNIIGAAFLIKTEIFKKFDFFDEYYYFCPEDIALSTLLNKFGYHCYVNSDAKIIHYGGSSGNRNVSKVKMATMPAGEKGSLRFFADGNILIYFLLGIFIILVSLIKCIYYKIRSRHSMDSYYIIYKANRNIVCSLLSSMTPKEIFIKYYKSI